MAFFLETLLGGLMSGMLYSLVALGFVLIFKASGVFNFAQGAMVLFAALAMARFSEWIPGWLGTENLFIANLLAFVVAVVASILFVRRQSRLTFPLLDFSIFRNAAFSSGVMAAAFAMFAIGGIQLVTTQRFQLVAGFSPLEAGLLVSAAALGDEQAICGLTVRTVDQPHGPVLSTGLRFDLQGRSIVYATDFSHFTDEMVALYAGCDLLITDCLRHEKHPTHASLPMALELAEQCGARHTVLTHMDKTLDYAANGCLIDCSGLDQLTQGAGPVIPNRTQGDELHGGQLRVADILLKNRHVALIGLAQQMAWLFAKIISNLTACFFVFRIRHNGLFQFKGEGS